MQNINIYAVIFAATAAEETQDFLDLKELKLFNQVENNF